MTVWNLKSYSEDKFLAIDKLNMQMNHAYKQPGCYPWMSKAP